MNIPFVDLKPQYQALKSKIDQRIQKVLDHGQFILGPEVSECEEALAKFVGCEHAIACGSGTDALILALMAIDIKPGDEVITTPFSFIATAETIVLKGATPVFVDIDPDTYNIDPGKIEEAISDKTKAIMPVSLYGQPADMDAINAIAAKHKLMVIEDAAQSFGATYKGKISCNLSDYGCTSFFPAKPLGCFGDGGAVFTNNKEWAEKLKSIRFHGQSERYVHPRVGINGRLDSLQCTIITVKLERYPWEVERRQQIATNYTKAFESIANIKTPKLIDQTTSVWAQYTIEVDNREGFQAKLKEKGVPTAVHYPVTMADQPAYKENTRCMDISRARKATERVMSLPMYADMPDEVQTAVIKAVKASV